MPPAPCLQMGSTSRAWDKEVYLWEGCTVFFSAYTEVKADLKIIHIKAEIPQLTINEKSAPF